MGLKIIRPLMTTDVQISVVPVVQRFFTEMEKSIPENTTYRIDAGKFLDDSGNKVEYFPPLNLNNSYFNVYINGFLQMEENFAYTAGEEGIGNLLITVPEGSEIPAGTPIILEVVNFEPVVNNSRKN